MNTHYSAYDKVGAALPVGAGQHDCCDILALQLYRGFLDSLGLDDAALLFCEPRLLKFVNVGGIAQRGDVHRLAQVIGDHIVDEAARLLSVDDGVLLFALGVELGREQHMGVRPLQLQDVISL